MIESVTNPDLRAVRNETGAVIFMPKSVTNPDLRAVRNRRDLAPLAA